MTWIQPRIDRTAISVVVFPSRTVSRLSSEICHDNSTHSGSDWGLPVVLGKQTRYSTSYRWIPVIFRVLPPSSSSSPYHHHHHHHHYHHDFLPLGTRLGYWRQNMIWLISLVSSSSFPSPFFFFPFSLSFKNPNQEYKSSRTVPTEAHTNICVPGFGCGGRGGCQANWQVAWICYLGGLRGLVLEPPAQ